MSGDPIQVLTNIATQFAFPSVIVIATNAWINRNKERSAVSKTDAETVRTDAEAGKTDAERDRLIVGTALEMIPHLRTEIQDLQREVEELRRTVRSLNDEVQTERNGRIRAEDQRDQAIAKLNLREA